MGNSTDNIPPLSTRENDMNVEILNAHGDKLSEVLNVTVSPIGADSVCTKHGIFVIKESVIDYTENVIRLYSEDYGITSEYEDEVNEWGVYLCSK